MEQAWCRVATGCMMLCIPPACSAAGLPYQQMAATPSLPQKLASQLNRATLWQVYQDTVSQPTELTAQGDRARTLGGQFVKAAGRRAVEEEVRWVLLRRPKLFSAWCEPKLAGGWTMAAGWMDGWMVGCPWPQPPTQCCSAV